MNTLQTVIALIFLPTSIVGGIVFVLRRFFEQGLARDIEKYKAKLDADLTHAKLRLENELQTKFFEFQTRFSLYHQKQVDVIETLYEMLSETEWVVARLVHPIPPATKTNDRPLRGSMKQLKGPWLSRASTVRNAFTSIMTFVKKMDAILKTMRKSVVTVSVGRWNQETRQPTRECGGGVEGNGGRFSAFEGCP